MRYTNIKLFARMWRETVTLYRGADLGRTFLRVILSTYDRIKQ